MGGKLRDLPDINNLIGKRLVEVIGPDEDGEMEFIFENGTVLTFDAPDDPDKRVMGIETED